MKVFCPTCGYANESGLGTGVTCASCGATFNVPSAPGALPPPPSLTAPPLLSAKEPAPYHPAAVAALALGILCCIPFANLGAIISGAIALSAIKNSGGQFRGREFAISGIVLGVLSFVLAVIAVVISSLTHR